MLLELRAVLMGGVHAGLAMKDLTVVTVKMGISKWMVTHVKVMTRYILLCPIK